MMIMLLLTRMRWRLGRIIECPIFNNIVGWGSHFYRLLRFRMLLKSLKIVIRWRTNLRSFHRRWVGRDSVILWIFWNRNFSQKGRISFRSHKIKMKKTRKSQFHWKKASAAEILINSHFKKERKNFLTLKVTLIRE